ncbi:metal ABC transporter substrate-binding protein [Pseudactinotalea sp. Z1739]|uniref:metal ABC transporter substrate-binding protein n=1 Tax=Pseudactinotalea sp. Z1739 TaxID=3413028 RepID=UPI003C7BC8E0
MTFAPRRRTLPGPSIGTSIGLWAAVALLAAGCLGGGTPNGGGGPDAGGGRGDDGRPVVLTTFTIIADIAQNVAGEHLQVRSLIPVGAEVHSYEPTPADLRQAADADLILDNGLGLEAWFDQFIADVQAPHVVVSDGVQPLEVGAPAGGATESEGAPAESRPNPHAWMSPRQTQVYVDNMVTAFSELDPDRAQDYRANGQAYAEELEAVHTELVDDLAALPQDRRALVTCEGAFSYLARDAALSEHYLWPVNAESEATPRRIADTITFVNAQQVPAVFCESTVSDAAMQQVVEATDATFGGVLYVDSLSEPDGPVPTYLDLIRHDVHLIRTGLTGAQH